MNATVLAGVVAVGLSVGLSGYLIPYMNQEQRVTADEITLTRMAGYGSTLQYALDRHTGNEFVEFTQHGFPFYGGYETVEVRRNAQCDCLTEIRRYTSGMLRVLEQHDKTVLITEVANFVRSKIVPVTDVADEFTRAYEYLNQGRENAADLIADNS